VTPKSAIPIGAGSWLYDRSGFTIDAGDRRGEASPLSRASGERAGEIGGDVPTPPDRGSVPAGPGARSDAAAAGARKCGGSVAPTEWAIAETGRSRSTTSPATPTDGTVMRREVGGATLRGTVRRNLALPGTGRRTPGE
jgi:hypothetical protein